MIFYFIYWFIICNVIAPCVGARDAQVKEIQYFVMHYAHQSVIVSLYNKCKLTFLSSGLIKGTKWAVLGEERIHSTLYWKESIVSAGFEPPIRWLRSERSTPDAPELLMNGHKRAYTKYKISCLQIIQVYAYQL